MWSMIKDEFRHILHNRLLLLSVTVICFIPFLYSIFFLKSVWDPYGSTQNLPVAVVNKDVPVEYQGRTMDVGKQTVNELKKNDQLKWEFVSAKKAKEGMANRKYYSVVTIPKDFSQNATTVLEKNPKPMKLHYETNGSLNYIGEVITQMGMTKLNEKIRASVTNAYANVMFKQLHVVGKGMSTAASGAKQLDTGIVTLSDGVNRYVAGVSQVNNGVQTLRVSVAPLASGAQQLASGSQTLANGIAQYTGGVGLLGNGVGQLMANSGALNSGANQLNSGLNTLMSKSADLQNGANELQKGLGTLSSNSEALQNGAAQVADGNQKLNATINTKLPEIKTKMGEMSNQVNANGQALNSALKPVSQTGTQLRQLSGQLGALSQGVDEVKSQISNAGGTNSQSEQLTAAANALDGVEASDSSKQQAIANAQNALRAAASAGSNNTQSTKLINSLNALQANIKKMQSAVDTSANTADQSAADVQKAANGLQVSLNNVQSVTGESLDTISGQLPEIQQLTDGANTLSSQIARYTNGVNSVATGAGTLSAGIGQYTAGVAQAGAGAGQLASGIGQYTAGVGQLGSGISQLNANSGALNAGAGQLAGALAQLNGQVPALVAGVNQLAAGTQQLQDNSPALIDGITRLNAGAGQLATALEGGAKKVNGIKTTPKTAKMFAEPTTLKHSNYSYVPNYGHALAPYVLSVALYVGALIFNFIYPIRRVADFGKSPAAWWASKVVVGSLVITLMAIAENAIMMACGLTVVHAPSFFLTTICFGLASMAIVMFLSMTFDNPGRFIAMVLLMLQLGGSGGTFPMEVTMKFYNVIHWYLPMTYSILGLRNSISGGLGEHYVMFCNFVLLGIAVVFFILLLIGMTWLQKHHFEGRSELDDNQELMGPEGDYDGMHLQQRPPKGGRD
jgi:putative membrane protein